MSERLYFRAVKHFMNDRDAIVTDALDAVVALGDGKLACLEEYKVIVRTDWDRSAVAIVSGGGSGHEPAHAGFVGDGLLTAAVCGDIFASPSVSAILAGILAVTGKAGCLLIVKSYTGDRLNFGLAAEKARALGLDVEMVIVSDDVALSDVKHPRGIAGTLFVHKVAGHLSRGGASLATIKTAAERVARSTLSLGVSLSSCTVPGRPAEKRMKDDEVELGLGIHGEPGASLIKLAPIHDLVKAMKARFPLEGNGRHAILINDLGGVPPIEMAVATTEILAQFNAALVVGPERLMTSLDMKGLSISALPLDPGIEEALRSPVAPHAWPGVREPVNVARVPLHPAMTAHEPRPSESSARRTVIESICSTLLTARAELDALDAKVGDGDTGSTFASGARTILTELDQLPLADGPALCAAISERLSKVMGGSSGILLAIFIAGVGAHVMRSPHGWPAALREGANRMQHYGGASEGDRTMLDALLPAIAALESSGSLQDAAKAARRGADHTASMTKAGAGRSSYVREDALRGIADPGAIAVALAFEALAGSAA